MDNMFAKRLGVVFLMMGLAQAFPAWAVNDAISTEGETITIGIGDTGLGSGGFGGGYYEIETQVFHEDLRLAGVPFGLHYSTRRMPGYWPEQSLCINAAGDSTRMDTVEVSLTPGYLQTNATASSGQYDSSPFFYKSYDEVMAQYVELVRQGLTPVSRATWPRSLTITVRPTVAMLCPMPVSVLLKYRWRVPGVNCAGWMMESVTVRQAALGVAGTRTSGLGGWTPDIQHVYCPLTRKLYFGSGAMVTLATAVTADSNGEYRVASGDEIHVFRPLSLLSIPELALATELRHEETLDRVTGMRKFRFEYDGDDRLLRVVDGEGAVTVIERDGLGVATAITGPHGQRTRLAVSGGSGGSPELLIGLVNPAGETNAMEYTAAGLLTSISSRRGHKFLMGYDTEGRLNEVRVAGEGVQTVTPIANRLGETDEADEETTFGLWANPFVVKTRRGSDASRALVRVTSGEGRVREYSLERVSKDWTRVRQWDGMGAWAQTGLLANRGWTNTAAPVADRMRSVRQEGTNWLADGTKVMVGTGADPQYGWQSPVVTQVVVRLPSGLEQALQGSLKVQGGDWDWRMNASGATSTVVYAASERKVTATTPEGRQAWAWVDASGRVSRVEQAGVYPVGIGYDGQGRPIRVEQGTGAVSRVLELGYGGDGRLSAITNGLGEVTTVERDAVGRVTNAVPADGRGIGLRYDRSERPAGVTPPGRGEHVLDYTPVGNLGSYEPPAVANGSGGLAWTYNRDRQLTGVVRPDGGALTNVYDEAGRLSRVAWPEGSVDFARDVAHRVIGLQAADGSGLKYRWDGLLPVEESWTGTVTGCVKRSYDGNFRLRELEVVGTDGIRYEYDRDGLLTQAGAMTINRQSSTGFMTTNVLDAITERVTVDGFGAVTRRETTCGGAGLYQVDYGYDKVGRVTGLVEVIGGETNAVSYRYDAAGYLAGVTGTDAVGGYVNTYRYDANGNRTQAVVRGSLATGEVDGQDRLLGYGGASYGYGATGTVTNKVDGEGRGTAYRYDARGVLLGVTRFDGQALTYRVDALGRRLGKRLPTGEERRWIYANGLKPVAELDEANRVVSVFVYGTSGLTPDYMIREGVRYRIVADRLGSPRLVANARSGEIVQRLDYDEWGRVTRDTNPGFQPFGFAGGQYDPDTGLVRFGARDYDPGTGRWLARDPILFAGGQENLYVYCNNNPVNFVDPLGLKTYLYLIGEDSKKLPLDNAAKYLSGLLNLGPDDSVVIQHISGFNDFNQALKSNKDIAQINYIGHGNPGILFIGIGTDPDTNISGAGGTHRTGGENFKSCSVNDLDTSNVRSDATIHLYSCFSGRAGWDYDSIARSFGQHFNVPAYGGWSGTKFKDNGQPYTFGGYIRQGK